MVEFSGIQKTTLADFPGEVATTLFLSGCNFRCGYCYNPLLVFKRDTGVVIPENEALEFLKERRKVIDGVCLTGGEPLMSPGLKEFIVKARALGYKIKLDTNGSFPSELKDLLDNKLLDYVAMDIKASLDKYDQVAGVKVELDKIQQSVHLLKESKIEYEFRTTVFSLLTREDFLEIGQWLTKGQRYFLQPIRTEMELLDPKFSEKYEAPGREFLLEVVEMLKPHFRFVGIRDLV